uniref:Uncharacterized protein n=1 Tax=Anguilla anguilla TaxID=7936 RepID=A0A0E9UT95_ANGAN
MPPASLVLLTTSFQLHSYCGKNCSRKQEAGKMIILRLACSPATILLG